ncbi:MAG TPA: FAD-linked oxidase C-terminal domain-containing protein [Egicoccus sp.]|nr:FAD-linked oxidase C-terminal domain-containing protein [Egicoccus sp.]HSK25111.1 FAD-linked oxidase C-terminal domain-containing protein [Egicoccus sp.]
MTQTDTPNTGDARPLRPAERALLMQLRTILEPDGLRDGHLGRATYRRDASFLNADPLAVVLPRTVEQTAEVLRACRDHGIPFTPRAAGTGLAGGATPTGEGGARPVVVSVARMDRLLDLDVTNRRAWVEAGLVNARLGRAVAPHGLRFAPDPASQIAATLGGNVATNAGGIHVLTYGVMSQHVLAVEMLDVDGEVHLLDGRLPEQGGLDLRGVSVGGEGTLGIVTKACLRLLPLPPAIGTMLAGFPSLAAAAATVGGLVTSDRLPDAVELMDARAIELVEGYAHAGYPVDAAAVLLLEYEGLPGGVAAGLDTAERVATANGATTLVRAADAGQRAKIWKGRKAVAGAIAQRAPDFYLQDVVVPRSRLGEMLDTVVAIGERESLVILNVVHAGDGNLHPFVLFDRRVPGMLDRVLTAGHDIVAAALRLGGTVTGEHGVGIEKRDFLAEIYDADDLAVQWAVRRAVEPSGLANPDKVLPTTVGCGEARLVPEGAWV